MAQNNQEIDIKVLIDTAQSATNITDLKKSLKDLKNAAASVEEGSDAFIKLAAAAGQAKNKIDDVGKSISSQAGAPLEKLAGGFSLLQNQVSTLNFTEASSSLKSLSSNISGLDFKTLTQGLGGFVKQLGQMAGALLGNPIFLLAAVVASLALLFKDQLAGAIQTVGTYLKDGSLLYQENLDKATKLYEADKARMTTLNSIDNILKLQGKSEEEILKIKYKISQQTIEDGIKTLAATIEQERAQQRTAEANKQILAGIISFIEAPITILLKTVDLLGKAVGKDIGAAQGFSDSIAKLVFDPEKTKKEADKVQKEQQAALLKLENDKAGFELAIQKIEKDSQTKKLAQAKDYNDKLTKLGEDRFKDAKAASDKQISIEKAEDLAMEALEKQGSNTTIQIDKSTSSQQSAIDAKSLENSLNNYKQQQAIDEAKLDGQKRIQSASLGAAVEFLNASQGLASQHAELQKALFIVGKAVSIAKIIVDTQSAMAINTANGLALAVPTLGASVAAAEATNIIAEIGAAASIAAIVATTIGQLGGGGSGGAPTSVGSGSSGGGGGTPAPTFKPQGLFGLGQGTNPYQQHQAPQKVYVTTQDIKKAGQRVEVIQSRSKIK